MLKYVMGCQVKMLYMPRSKANGFFLQKRHVRMTLVSRY